MNEENIKNTDASENAEAENNEVTENASEESVAEENISENNIEETAVNVQSEEVIENTAETEAPPQEDGDAQMPEAEPQEENVVKDFIDEFTPASINIPNYNREKEMKKREKASLKKKKSGTKKNKKRRRMIRKIVNVTRTVVLSILLFAVSTAALSSVIVRVNTSEFAVESAVKNYGPERITVGKIGEPEKLGMSTSSDKASMADILRDNATIPVTYAQIEQAVDKSTFPEFVSGITADIIGYYVFGDTYNQVGKDEIADVMYKNSSKIKIVTGRELDESECEDFADYISKSPVYKEISASSLKKQDASDYTYITSVIFSFPVLIGMVIAFMLVLVLVVASCRGYAHKIIGWALMLAGALCGVAGLLFKPMYTASTEFVGCIVDAVTAAFNKNSLICGVVVLAIGLLVLLAGSAMKDNESDDDDDEEDEDEYIEEIEQVSTAL